MSPLDIYKFKISKISNFDIYQLIKQRTHFWCSSSYLRFSRLRWVLCYHATSVVLDIFITGLLILMHRIVISIKNISTDASYNSQWASKEDIHATLTPLGRFYAFAGISEGINNPDGDIIMVLGKSEAEPKVDFFWWIWGLVSTLLISQLNWKKLSPPGLSLSLSELTLTVLTDIFRDSTSCRWLTPKTQHITLFLTLIASVNVACSIPESCFSVIEYLIFIRGNL